MSEWQIETMTGRTDKHGNPLVYTVTKEEDYACTCMAYRCQKKRLFNGQVVHPEWGDEVNGYCKHIMFVIENYERGFDVHAAWRAQRRGESFVIQNREMRMEIPHGRIAGMLSRMNVVEEATVTEDNKFEEGVTQVTGEVEEIRSKLNLSRQEMRDILNIVQSDYA